MLRKTLSLLLITLLFHLSITSAGACQQAKKDIRRAAEIKQEIIRRSTAEKKLVRIKLLDGREIKGEIIQAGEDTFLIRDIKTGLPASVSYGEVKRIQGKGLSTFKKVAIGWVAAGILITLFGANK